jgi:vacuolar-type H+-ATPase subunit H
LGIGTKSLETPQAYVSQCVKMERVWEELKKIEAQAQQIQSEAQNKAKNITILADQEAETLLDNSKKYADEEAKQLYDSTIQEANSNREKQLKTNQETAKKMEAQAKKRMDQAVLAVVNAVLEETKP